MIKKGNCLCLNVNCYENFSVEDAMFKLKIDIELSSLTSQKEQNKQEQNAPSSLRNDDFSGDEVLNSATHTKDVKHIEKYFKVKNGKVIYDADTNIANQKAEEVYTKYGINISINFNSYENGNNISINYTVYVNNQICKQERGKTLNNRFCPKCKESLTEHMGFCDWYIVMPIGDTNSGKTTFLNTAYNKLQEKSPYQIANYTITKGGPMEDRLTKERIDPTRSTAEADNLFAYFRLMKPENNGEVMLLFRDNAGEKCRDEEGIDEFKNRLYRFTQYVDGLMIFNHFYGISGIVNRVEKESVDANTLLNGMDKRVKIEESNVIDTVKKVQMKANSQDEPKAAMYVFAMSDCLEAHFDRLNLEEDGLYGLKNSEMFSKNYIHSKDYIHQYKFDFSRYFNCAYETHYFLSAEDRSYTEFVNLAANLGWHRGVTAISSLATQPRRIDEVFGWFITCLIEKKDFNKPITQQRADDYQ